MSFSDLFSTLYHSLSHGAHFVAQTSQGADIAFQDEMVEDTFCHIAVPHIQNAFAPVYTQLSLQCLLDGV